MGGPVGQPPQAPPTQSRFAGQLYLPKGLATTSLVLGIIGLVTSALFGCLWFFSMVWLALDVLAIIFGAIAISKARRGEAGGEGMARAGLVCGIVGFLAVVIWIVLIIAGIYWAYNYQGMYGW